MLFSVELYWQVPESLPDGRISEPLPKQEPDELLEVLEIGGCSLVLVIPGILMMGEGILTWMAVKNPSRISGACLLSGLMVGVCALPVALFSWMEDDAMLYGSIVVLAASILVFVFLVREKIKAQS